MNNPMHPEAGETHAGSINPCAAATAIAWSPCLIDLYTTKFDQLVSVAARIVRDEALAEDCVQEAFLKFQAKHVVTQPGKELAYLRTMVRNGAITAVRASARQRETAQRLPQPQTVASAESMALSALRIDEICGHVGQLAPRQAAVVELRLAGMSVAETATELNLASGTVKTHRHRAAETMRETMRDLLDDPVAA